MNLLKRKKLIILLTALFTFNILTAGLVTVKAEENRNNGQNGTTLSAEITSLDAYWEYDWSLDKTVSPGSSIEITKGNSGDLSYTLRAERTSEPNFYIPVSVFVENGGDQDTKDLNITFGIEYQKASGGSWESISDNVASFKEQEIPAHNSSTFTHIISFVPPIGAAQLRITAYVTISNHSGSNTTGTQVREEVNFPDKSTARDAAARLEDSYIPIEGFSITRAMDGSETIPQILANSKVVKYTLNIKNDSVEYENTMDLINNASLAEGNLVGDQFTPGSDERTDSETVKITTGSEPGNTESALKIDGSIAFNWQYDWTVKKTVSPESGTDFGIKSKSSKVFDYVIDALRDTDPKLAGFKVSATVENTGEKAAENLLVDMKLSYKTLTSEDWVLLDTKIFAPETLLAAGDNKEFNYVFAFTPPENAAQYHVVVEAKADNALGWVKDWLLNPSTPLQEDVVSDASAEIDDKLDNIDEFTAAGFKVENLDPEVKLQQVVNQNTQIKYSVKITNENALDGREYTLSNTASLQEGDREEGGFIPNQNEETQYSKADLTVCTGSEHPTTTNIVVSSLTANVDYWKQIMDYSWTVEKQFGGVEPRFTANTLESIPNYIFDKDTTEIAIPYTITVTRGSEPVKVDNKIKVKGNVTIKNTGNSSATGLHVEAFVESEGAEGIFTAIPGSNVALEENGELESGSKTYDYQIIFDAIQGVNNYRVFVKASIDNPSSPALNPDTGSKEFTTEGIKIDTIDETASVDDNLIDTPQYFRYQLPYEYFPRTVEGSRSFSFNLTVKRNPEFTGIPAGTYTIINKAALTENSTGNKIYSDPVKITITVPRTTPTEPPITPPAVDPGKPDLKITKTDNGKSAKPGEEVEYTITVENIGSNAATNIKINEALPENTKFVEGKNDLWKLEDGKYVYSIDTLFVGQKKEVKFVLAVDSSLSQGINKIINNVEVKCNETEDSYDNNKAAEETPVTVSPVETSAKLEVVKTDGGIAVMPGEKILYSITVKNTGTKDAAEVKLEEMLPQYTLFLQEDNTGWVELNGKYVYEIGSIAPGEEKAAFFAVQTNNNIPSGIDAVQNNVIVHSTGLSDVNASDDTPLIRTTDLPETGRNNYSGLIFSAFGMALMLAGIVLKSKR